MKTEPHPDIPQIVVATLEDGSKIQLFEEYGCLVVRGIEPFGAALALEPHASNVVKIRFKHS